MNQTSIFDIMYPKYKIDKPIRLIEFFGGYGSQALALKYSSVHFEHWKLCEWAVKSIQAYTSNIGSYVNGQLKVFKRTKTFIIGTIMKTILKI